MSFKYFHNGAEIQLPVYAREGGTNPVCPNCKRYNAMLFDRECDQPSDDHVLKCRDCGAEVIVVISETRNLESLICDSLSGRPGLALGQLAEITGIKQGPVNSPMSSPLNHCLARMRDEGQIRANDQWGEPRFFLVD